MRRPRRRWHRRGSAPGTRCGWRRAVGSTSWWTASGGDQKNRPNASLLARQLARYAACEEVEQLLVLAPRGVNLPRTIGGKRVTMMGLERLWGIGLP